MTAMEILRKHRSALTCWQMRRETPRNRGTENDMAQQKRTLFKKLTLVFLVSLGIYLIWCTIVWNRQPTIKVDYLALVNEKALSIPEEDSALPLYLDAAIAIKADQEPGYKDDLWDNQSQPHWPYHDGWGFYSDWLQRHSATLKLIREAGSKPNLGYVLGRVSEKEKLLYGEDWNHSFLDEDNPLLEGSLLSVSLPAYSTFRQLAMTLRHDARQAAFEGDQSRFVSDIDAIFRLASHIRETPMIIGDLVAISIASMGYQVAGETLSLSPDFLDEEHLTRLSDLCLGSEDLYNVRFESERLIMTDLVQRLYTDDGNGDGSFIVYATPLLEFVTSFTEDSVSPVPQALAFLSGPIASWRVASRQETLAEFERLFDLSIEQNKIPLYKRDSELDLGDSQDRSFRYRFVIVDVMMPNIVLPALAGTYSLTQNNSVVAAIAMELYRRAEGEWPTDLTQAMENPPLDPWSGEPIKIAFEDGRPLLYSIGVDRNDDNGNYHSKDLKQDIRSPWMAYLEPERMFSDYEGYSADTSNGRAKEWKPVDSDSLPDGDWILWPPIID